ncbi:hypothetical protein EDEG_00860 [Edhazardia aedis USNM 41457]|uniref:Coatomer subunit beta n=1 Tax=Edhazardia aedis (strain USNM 41457) TaxID=1003232 RepID=J9DC81_EDHAE|nr:hypothetical protein EDEG_00860 [Edhazardia aedis USNM 41457]|eukprot:EJW05079.1 hypothetical protein EDEG_00860 [Edhazardia aedis USNM 41457]
MNTFIMSIPSIAAPNMNLLRTDINKFLESVIIYESQNKDTSEFVMSVIKEVLRLESSSKLQNSDKKVKEGDVTVQTAKNKRMMQLFYMYIDLLKKRDNNNTILAEMLLLVNHIRKDILSVNHYTRVRSLYSVLSFIDLQPVVDNFYAVSKENLGNSNYLVRRNAVNLLKCFWIDDKVKYSEVFDNFIDLLNKECDPFVLREVIRSLYTMENIKLTDYINNASIESCSMKASVDSINNEKKLDILELLRKYNFDILNNASTLLKLDDYVLEYIIQYTNNLNFIYQCIDRIPFQSGMRLIQEYTNLNSQKTGTSKDENKCDYGYIGSSEIDWSKIIRILLESSRSEDAFKEITSQRIDSQILSDHISKLTSLYKTNKIFQTKENFHYLFAACTTNEDFCSVNMLLNEILNNTHVLEKKIEILKVINYYFNTYNICDESILQSVKNLLNSDVPGIAFESLKIISDLQSSVSDKLNNNREDSFADKSIVSNSLTEIIDLNNIKYGRILRKALSLLSKKIKTEDDILQFVILFEKALETQDNSSNEAKPILQNLNCPKVPFIGNAIALFFEKLYSQISCSKQITVRIIALLLKFIKQGNSFNKIDKSSEITIYICIKSIASIFNNKKSSSECNSTDKSTLSTNTENKITSHASIENDLNLILENHRVDHETEIEIKENDLIYENHMNFHVKKSNETLDPISFTFLPMKNEIKQEVENQNKPREETQQLTSQSDPIYAEAKIKISKYEIIIDLLLINQTKSTLQNINIELITSSNISIDQNLSLSVLQPGIVKNKTIKAKINECSDSFVCGTISFAFLKNNQFKGSYTLNIEPISFFIRDFLKTPDIYTEDKFKENWVKMEWENTYNIKMAPNKLFNSSDFNDILDSNSIKSIETTRNSKTDLVSLQNKILNNLKGYLVSKENYDSCAVMNIACKTTLDNTILVNLLLSIETLVSIEARIRSDSEDVVKSISKVISETVKLK